ncbi:aminotransferase class V-fold PLP-dependent enzyme [Ovoidimarina sediminis]|uniref:aminotransferase class V-fold PLP-dependent enzyme n=1 Tax=Ovoidimarina sediminis TaxID=3079856 RepID=UPI002914642F|nr:aminotransferase class V-fold PLP-dependent enzyme [Rhodophyticola sp. MJ-SS7]MDU8944360.1 aminotransferase class V-fold PLP-dependent enzyme [Rhodophyticola sp. MJ-SS7]
MKLDIRFVRGQFPAFSEKSLKGLAHFENAGGSYACGPVIDRLTRFYKKRKMQPYGPSKPSARGGAEMDEARRRLAAMLNVAENELHFGPSTTQNTYVLARAFAGAMRPGEAIIVTNQDHEANSGPWRRLAEAGIEVREWRMVPETGHLHIADLTALLDERVRLVCFPHCSNVVGEINDVAAIVDLVHAAGAFACVDGVSFAPHGLPDVGALGADIYLFSAYKTYGPHQGIMTIRADLAAALPAQGHYFNAEVLTKRFTPAGPDHAQIAASAGMADYIDALYAHHAKGEAAEPAERCSVVAGLMRRRETKLLKPLMAYLADRKDVRVLGPEAAGLRAPTVAIVTDRPGRAIAEALAPHGIMADGGDFYAVRPLQALGIAPEHGVFRASFVHYTTRKEVDRLIAALDHVL